MDNAGDRSPEWGSDSFAAVLEKLNLEYIALNPGASYRGLHDSLVNFTSGCRMLLCIHEETAVSIAQGWAKVTGRAMGVALHSNVGLLHASMSIYNAWCDRMPMLIIGATGPVDAMKRRPWIDWVHTSQDQGALIREFVSGMTSRAVLARPARPWPKARRGRKLRRVGRFMLTWTARCRSKSFQLPSRNLILHA
jgi:hypothetical protein